MITQPLTSCSASQAAISSPRPEPGAPVGVTSSTRPANPCAASIACNSATVLPYRHGEDTTISAPTRDTSTYRTRKQAAATAPSRPHRQVGARDPSELGQISL